MPCSTSVSAGWCSFKNTSGKLMPFLWVLVLASLVSVALWDRSPGAQLSQKGPCSWMLCWCHLDVLSNAVLWFVLVSLVGQGTQALGASAPCGRPPATSHLLYPKPPQKYSPFLLLSSNGCCLSLGAWRSQATRASKWCTGARSQDGQHACWVNLSPTPAQIPARRVQCPWGSSSPGKGRLGAVRPKSARLGASSAGRVGSLCLGKKDIK